MYMFFVMHRLEDGHINGRNIEEVYCVYNVSSYTYAHLLGLITISKQSVRRLDDLKFFNFIFPVFIRLL